MAHAHLPPPRPRAEAPGAQAAFAASTSWVLLWPASSAGAGAVREAGGAPAARGPAAGPVRASAPGSLRGAGIAARQPHAHTGPRCPPHEGGASSTGSCLGPNWTSACGGSPALSAPSRPESDAQPEACGFSCGAGTPKAPKGPITLKASPLGTGTQGPAMAGSWESSPAVGTWRFRAAREADHCVVAGGA